MKLSDTVDEETVAALRAAVERDDFPGISFEQAMEFLLTGGLFPADGLPVTSFYRLEDWVRCRASHRLRVKSP
jgi:hypothetical protein